MIAHDGGETLEPGGTVPAHTGDGRGDQMHTEQIRHQRGQTLLGQKLKVQQINHDTRDARTVLHWRAHVFGKGRARLRAALRAATGMRAVFRDNQRLWFREVEHLPRGMTGSHRLAQAATAPRAGLGEMIDRRIRCIGSAQRLAGMTFLTAGLLARSFTQAAHPYRLLLQSIAGWGLAAIAAVQSKLTFQFGDACILRRYHRPQLGVLCL
jgi:hypothetical protein